jgi:hypothetical protein
MLLCFLDNVFDSFDRNFWLSAPSEQPVLLLLYVGAIILVSTSFLHCPFDLQLGPHEATNNTRPNGRHDDILDPLQQVLGIFRGSITPIVLTALIISSRYVDAAEFRAKYWSASTMLGCFIERAFCAMHCREEHALAYSHEQNATIGCHRRAGLPRPTMLCILLHLSSMPGASA